jgi:hypothetical protein
LLAAVSTMVVGSLWYGKVGFGNVWMKLSGSKPDPDFNSKKATILYGGAFLLSLITAYILAHFAYLAHDFYGNGWVQDSVTTAILAWLGFTAARIAMHDQFEQRRKKLTVLNATHELVTLVVMGLIIGLLHP